MMHKITLKIFALILFCVFSITVESQSNCFNVQFEIDGKNIQQDNMQIFIYLNGKEIKLSNNKNMFFFPTEIKRDDTLDARVLCGNHDLYFSSLHASHLQTAWIVGIDNKPFSKSNLEAGDSSKLPHNKYLQRIYYIRFIPDDGEETNLVVKEFKKRESIIDNK